MQETIETNHYQVDVVQQQKERQTMAKLKETNNFCESCVTEQKHKLFNRKQEHFQIRLF